MATKNCPNCGGKGTYVQHGTTCICSMCAGQGKITKKQIQSALQLFALAQNAGFKGRLF